MELDIANTEPLLEGPQRFAPFEWRFLYVLQAIVLTALPLALLAVFTGSPWNVLCGAGAFGALLVGIHNGSRIALTLDAEGATVANFWRVQRVAWAEVSAIELWPGGLGPGYVRVVVFVRRGSGMVWANATASLRDRRRALQALEPIAERWGIRFDVPADVLGRSRR